MSFDDSTYEKIGLYIDNQMSDAERTAFEEVLKNDTELAAFVDTLTSLESVYNEDTWNIKSNASAEEIKALANEFRADDVVALSQKIRSIQQQKNTAFPKKRNKSYFYIISSAVAIAAVMTLFYFTFMQSITASEAFEQYHDWSTLPSFVEKGVTDDNRVKAQALFQDGNYQEALHIFMETAKDTTYDPKVQLYIGICYLELQNYHEAIQTFDELRNSNTLDNHKAYWYTALVYLKQNNAETAKKVLQTLVQDTGNYNYEKAKELLKKLE
ncbi:tetratricopeptide repeat protein [Kordia periserrulae]|uniref:Tetratricopeptide repeat protein n=1 Tax=Kordia periserrulae TaxID=701523 RepID=A0A2T6BVN8_9FLAO|nr:tetratricopeptide repeat protein [Kordia periserrulae]PTX60148.1 tetratricopeptide repeat protein [Kordia periserrulae]